MDYKVVEVYKHSFDSKQVIDAENEAKLLGKEGWRLISTIFTDRNSIVLFFERNKNDEEE